MSNDFNIPPGTQTSKQKLVHSSSIPPESKIDEQDTRIKYKDENQLNEFWNCILKKQNYKKTINIKGLTVVLRTKTSKEIEELMRYMDKNQAVLISTYDYVYSKALLALSLVKYGEDYLDSGTFLEKIGYVDNLPDVILRLLIKAAASFEKEIEQMEAEIYSLNF